MKGALILNETTAVNPAAESAWLRWMMDIQIPGILGTGCFYKHQLVKILDNDEAEGAVYALQLFTETAARYHEWLRLYEAGFSKAVGEKWGQQALSFRTLMSIVQ